MIRKKRVFLLLLLPVFLMALLLFWIPKDAEDPKKADTEGVQDLKKTEKGETREEIYRSFLSRGSFQEGTEVFKGRQEQNPGKDEEQFCLEAAEDLAILAGLDGLETVQNFSFATPEGAAAGACYLSAKQKLQLIIDESSELLGRADGNLSLKDVTGGNLWKKKELARLSEEVAGAHPYLDVRLFQAELFGALFQVTVVMDSETFRYRIFSLKRTDGTKGMQIKEAKRILAGYPEENPEEWFP